MWGVPTPQWALSGPLTKFLLTNQEWQSGERGWRGSGESPLFVRLDFQSHHGKDFLPQIHFSSPLSEPGRDAFSGLVWTRPAFLTEESIEKLVAQYFLFFVPDLSIKHLAVPFSFPVNLRPLSILFDLKIVWNLIYLCFLFSCLIVPTNRPPSTHLLTGRTNENPFWTSKHWIVIYNVKKTPTGKAGLRWFFNQNLKRLTSFLPLLGWIIIFFLFLFERALFEGDVWTNIKNICWTNKGSLPSPIF